MEVLRSARMVLRAIVTTMASSATMREATDVRTRTQRDAAVSSRSSMGIVRGEHAIAANDDRLTHLGQFEAALLRTIGEGAKGLEGIERRCSLGGGHDVNERTVGQSKRGVAQPRGPLGVQL